MSKETVARVLASAFVASCAFALTACGGEEKPESASDAVQDVQDAAEDAADEAREATEE